VLREHGLSLCAADIEIVPDAHGRPEVGKELASRLGVKPVISITHSHGIAAAAATLDRGSMIGIDMELAGRTADSYERLAFREQERDWLGKLPATEHDEWALRLWTAKEAVSKALGQGFHQGLHSLHVEVTDFQAGTVEIELSNGLAAMFPHLAGRKIQARTERDGEVMTAATFFQA